MGGCNKFTFFKSYRDALQEMKPSDRLAIYDAITSYAFDGEEVLLKNSTQRIAFALIKPNLDASLSSIENGGKGGRPRKEKEGFPKNKKGGFEKSKTDKDKEKDKDMDIGNGYGYGYGMGEGKGEPPFPAHETYSDDDDIPGI